MLTDYIYTRMYQFIKDVHVSACIKTYPFGPSLAPCGTPLTNKFQEQGPPKNVMIFYCFYEVKEFFITDLLRHHFGATWKNGQES